MAAELGLGECFGYKCGGVAENLGGGGGGGHGGGQLLPLMVVYGYENVFGSPGLGFTCFKRKYQFFNISGGNCPWTALFKQIQAKVGGTYWSFDAVFSTVAKCCGKCNPFE